MFSSIAKRSSWLRALYWWLRQFGIDPRAMGTALCALPRFVTEYFRFRRGYEGRLRIVPSLHDRMETAGVIGNEYFWQDLYAAQEIFRRNPVRHVDVGSRFDGFIAHVASFRTVEVLDIRPIDRNIPNVVFRQADLMKAPLELIDYCDSLSCLHALEHFGLGRYGDPLDPNGHVLGIRNLARMLKVHGVLYLSCPVGLPRVEFNSHRIVDPTELVNIARDQGLQLEKFAWIDGRGVIAEADEIDSQLRDLATREYSLGIFLFRKS